MAQVEESGGRPSPNVELNLVPFIDLMCVCITFLLITAVWTQISMIELGTSVYGKKSEEASAPPPPVDTLAFRLDVRTNGFTVKVGLEEIQVPKVAGEYDERTLRQVIHENVRLKMPGKTDAVVAMGDELPYELLIRGMDVLIAEGFTDIGIATGEVR